MNAIDRRGMKVVCIAVFEFCLRDGTRYPGPIPELNEEYTVADFISNDGNIAQSVDGLDLFPGITLREVPTLRGLQGSTEIVFGWPIVGFRPLLTRETDISALVEIGKRTDLSTSREDVLAMVDAKYSFKRHWREMPPLIFSCRCTRWPNLIIDPPWKFGR